MPFAERRGGVGMQPDGIFRTGGGGGGGLGGARGGGGVAKHSVVEPMVAEHSASNPRGLLKFEVCPH